MDWLTCMIQCGLILDGGAGSGNFGHSGRPGSISGSGGGLTVSSKKNKIKKTKYAPSPRRSRGGIEVGTEKYGKLCGIMNSRFPGLQDGEIRAIRDSQNQYLAEADGYGGMKILKVWSLK